MGPADVVAFVVQILAQLGLLPVIQAIAVILAAAAIVNYFVKR